MDVLGWMCSQFSSSSPLINIIYWPWPLRGLWRDGRRNLKVSISQSALEKWSVNMVMWQPNKSGECQRQKGITIRSDSPQKPLAHLKLTAPDLVTGSWCNANATPSFTRSLPHSLSLIPLVVPDMWLISNGWPQRDSTDPCCFTALLRSPFFNQRADGGAHGNRLPPAPHSLTPRQWFRGLLSWVLITSIT